MRVVVVLQVNVLRILMCSRWFSPSVGGVETVSALLADEFSRLGCSVTVVTNTPGPQESNLYEIVRNPSATELFRLGQSADIVLQNLISLRFLAPLLLSRTPIAVAHHCWLRRTDGSIGWENHVKRLVVRGLRNISISTAIANSLPVKSTVIHNPFDRSAFAAAAATTARTGDIVFLGRLVHDKGCHTLLRAIAKLQGMKLVPFVTVVGDGPERKQLESECRTLGIEEQVRFLGTVREGKEKILAAHRVMVVPSLWAEPFGMVALEGAAAGCALVASSDGGLQEAAGDCALYFKNGDASMLASTLETVLTRSDVYNKLVNAAPNHLARFDAKAISLQYLAFFRDVIGSSPE